MLVVLQMLGSLGVFLYGMKIMSEALQKVAGGRLKSLLAKITANRFTAVLTGLAITSVVQSSSATTVMVVSFVSAGLMNLAQAIGVIMGANIGTTLTAWMVALLGFKVNVASFALPAIGIGLPLTFVRGARPKQYGEMLLGFGLLFLGLQLIKDSIPQPEDTAQLAWMQPLVGHGFLSILIFVGLGLVFTLILQSSTATTTLTLTLAAMGWIPYELALAMVLGENIGTTVTANLAALGGSVDAKRAARAHFLFNVFGVLWSLALFYVYMLPMVDWLVPGDPTVDLSDPSLSEDVRAAGATAITTHLAAFHSLFNVTNTLVMLPLVGVLERLVRRMVPDGKGKKPVVRYISTTLIETPGLMMIQAGKEMQHMTGVVREMFADTLQILTQPDRKQRDLMERVMAREDLVDEMEREIVDHLTRTARAATSTGGHRSIASMIQNVHRLERVADHCSVLVRIAQRIDEHKDPLTEQELADIKKLGALVDESLANVGLYLTGQSAPSQAEVIEQKIDDTRRRLRARMLEQMKVSPPDDLQRELGFLDAITHMEEIGDRAAGIVRHAEMMRRL